MKTVGIIVAMDREIAKLKSEIDITDEVKICNVTFYKGTYDDTNVVFTTAGIGKVNAGITTILMIEHFNPNLIINTGIAGGYHKSLKPLDIVVADKVIYSDVDMTSPAAGGYDFGQLEGFDSYFQPKCELTYGDENLHYGTILTGDQFVVDYEKTALLVQQKFPKYDVIAFDMESGSIAQVCTLNHTDFLIIRAISDIIGSTNSFDYQKFSVEASNKVASVVLNLIKK